MNGYYRADAVNVEGTLFESLPTAVSYITDNYREWCGLGNFTDTTLVSVEVGVDGAVWVKYTLDEDDYADDPERVEPYYYTSLDIITAV